MKTKIFSNIMLAICATVMMTACSADDEFTSNGNRAIENEMNDKGRAQRTVVVYMAADNDLTSDLDSDLQEMKEGSMKIGNNNLIVFVDRQSETELPWMARIQNGEITDSVSIADMGLSDKEEYSSDPRVMEGVLTYAFGHYTAERDYGLVLWGHSTGWIIEQPLVFCTRGFGVDTGMGIPGSNSEPYWLNVPTIREVLSKMPHLSFIMADCCQFMCLESLYELRGTADYIMGSPAEVPSAGAPYDTVIPALFERNNFATSAMERYAEAYNNYLPLAVVKTSEMENVAHTTRNIMQNININLGDGYADMGGLVHYGYLGTMMKFSASENIFYDAGDFIKRYASDSDYRQWKQTLDRAVVWKRMAPRWKTKKDWNTFYTDFTMTAEKYHGVSMFIPQNPNSGRYATLNKNIKEMQWYKEVLEE